MRRLKMKNKVWNKQIRIRLTAAGLAGALGLGICGCGAAGAQSASRGGGMEEMVQEDTMQGEVFRASLVRLTEMV